MNKNNLTAQKESFTATEYESLVEIMAFFNWDKFKKLETLERVDGDGELDLDEIKEYVINTFRYLVEEAKKENHEYFWLESNYNLRFEYRKDVGLYLMYVPIHEGDV